MMSGSRWLLVLIGAGLATIYLTMSRKPSAAPSSAPSVSRSPNRQASGRSQSAPSSVRPGVRGRAQSPDAAVNPQPAKTARAAPTSGTQPLTDGALRAPPAHEASTTASSGRAFFEWGGALTDQVGRGPRTTGPDGKPDALFKLGLPRGDKVISKITLRRPNTRQVWRSYENAYGNWMLGVFVNGRRIYPDRSGDLRLALAEAGEFDLFASDDWVQSNWFERGQRYEVEIAYESGAKPDTLSLVIP
jgi:hypothetical protein